MVNRFFWWVTFSLFFYGDNLTGMDTPRYNTAQREKNYSRGVALLTTIRAIATGVGKITTPWVPGVFACLAVLSCGDWGLRQQGYDNGLLCCCNCCNSRDT